jgi:hypothetical protein
MKYPYDKTRLFDGQRFKRSALAETKKEAIQQADYWRSKGVKVRVVKSAEGYSLFTR